VGPWEVSDIFGEGYHAERVYRLPLEEDILIHFIPDEHALWKVPGVHMFALQVVRYDLQFKEHGIQYGGLVLL